MVLDLGTLRGTAELETREFEQGARAVSARIADLGRRLSTVEPLDIDVDQAERRLEDVAEALLRLADGPEVQLDVESRGALGQIEDVVTAIRGIPDGQADVDIDTSRAERTIDGLGDDAESSLTRAGDDAGDGFGRSVTDAIGAIPIAGAVVAVGVAIGAAIAGGIQDGLSAELERDLFSARTGLDEATARTFARAAGEAYGDAFGESVEENLDVARQAVQQGLLDPDATVQASEQIISSLQGVSSVIGEEVAPITRATTRLLATGLVRSADEAFDVLVRGQQLGVNAAEDLLDTLTEYPTDLARIGLSAEDALGLFSQGLQAGARDTDFLADALREFQIRAQDASLEAVDGFDQVGISAEQLGQDVGAGGDRARDALQTVLDGLRGIEDPLQRNELAISLFGTRAEELGDSLFALDLNTIAQQLGDVDGAAAGAIDTLGGNAATGVQSAFRNIELAIDAVQEALAAAFGPEIENIADRITGNRELVIRFLAELVDGAFDVAEALAEAAASGTEGFGTFVGSLAPVQEAIGQLLVGLSALPGVSAEVGAAGAQLIASAPALEQLGEDASEAGDRIREDLIDNGLTPARERLDDFLDVAISDARLNDTLQRVATSIDDVGVRADGTAVSLTNANEVLEGTTTAGREVAEAVFDAAAGIRDAEVAAREAGAEQSDLAEQTRASADALVAQLTQLGLTEEQALDVAAAYGIIPGQVTTDVSAPGATRTRDQLLTVDQRARNIPDRRNVAVSTSGTGAAAGALAGVAAEVRNIPTSRIIQVSANIGASVGRARAAARFNTGGEVTGPPGRDVIPALLTAGEFVLDRGDVDRLGGPAGVQRLRDALERSGGVSRLATGGLVGGSAAVPAGASGSGPQPVVIIGNDSRAADLVAELLRVGAVELGGLDDIART